MSVIIIDDAVKERAKELLEYAEKNPYLMDELLDIYNGDLKPPGLQAEFQMEIPVGYKVVFTMDQYPQGLFRHMSMSIISPGKLPSPDAVNLVLPLFGFKNLIDGCYVTFEGPENDPIAIQVIELI